MYSCARQDVVTSLKGHDKRIHILDLSLSCSHGGMLQLDMLMIGIRDAVQ